MLLADDVASVEHSIAEMSRPNRAFKQQAKEASSRQCQIKNPTIATRITWYNPFLWRHFEDAANQPSMKSRLNASQIVKYLQKKDPQLFVRLTRQVVARMIDFNPKDGGRPRWTQETLTAVQNAAQGVPRPPTHGGILVGHF